MGTSVSYSCTNAFRWLLSHSYPPLYCPIATGRHVCGGRYTVAIVLERNIYTLPIHLAQSLLLLLLLLLRLFHVRLRPVLQRLRLIFLSLVQYGGCAVVCVMSVVV